MIDARILDERIDGLRHTFRVSLLAKRVDAAVDARLLAMRRTAPIPGFRPGRAPLAMLRNYHGQQVRLDVMDRMAIDVARRLVADKQLEPSGRPTIRFDDDSTASGTSVAFSLMLDVFPSVKLAPFSDIQIRRLQVEGDNGPQADAAAEHLRRELFDALLARHNFPVPGDMVESEYARIARGFEAQVGESVDQEVASQLRRIADRRIRLAILLTEIGREYDIRVPRAEVEALVEQEAERDPAHRDEIIDYYLDHPTALAELQSPLFEERVVEFLLARVLCD